MKLVIAGSRSLRAEEVVRRAIFEGVCILGYEPSEIVSGAAPGVDRAGELWARVNGVPVRHFPADWRRHGRAAGPIRNREMAEYADALIAVWDGGSRGTAHMIDEMRRRGKPVVIATVTDGEVTVRRADSMRRSD